MHGFLYILEDSPHSTVKGYSFIRELILNLETSLDFWQQQTMC